MASFESLADAEAEKKHRARLLSGADPETKALNRQLERCGPGDRCRLGICPVCFRRHRINSSAAILRFLADYPTESLRFVTLINPADAVRAGELSTFDPKKLVNRLRRQLERAGVGKETCFLIGAVDGEWDEGWDVYQPHVHAVSLGLEKSHLLAIARGWPKTTRVRVPTKIEPIDDLPRVVAYLRKSWWPCVARSGNPNGIHPHQKRRPSKSVEMEILIWLYHSTYHSTSTLFGVKIYNNTIDKT